MEKMISKEDLLLKIVKLKAENSLLRNKLVECGKDKSLIEELEFKLKHKLDSRIIELNNKIDKLTKTIDNQRQTLRRFHQNGDCGERPTPDIDKLLHDFAIACGYDDQYHLCAMSENVSTEHMKQFALYYHAAMN